MEQVHFVLKNNPQTLSQFVQEMNKKDFIPVKFIKFHWNEEDSSFESVDILFLNRKSPSYSKYATKYLPSFS